MLLESFLTPLVLVASPMAAIDWEKAGRPLPQVENTSVALDERLDEYAPCHSEIVGVKNGSVTTILPDLFDRWSAGFNAHHPGTSILSAPPYGPPQGRMSEKLAEFIAGKSDFALVSRRLSVADLIAFRKAHNHDPIVIPVAAGSWRHFGFADTLVVIVNKANPLKRISFAQIDAIFSSTRLRSLPAAFEWGALDGHPWVGRAIHPVGGAMWSDEDSARSAVIRERVLNGGRWRAELAEGGDEASAVDRVATDPYAIAISGLGHVGPGVRALAISAAADGEFVVPTFENVRLNIYPLSRTIDLLLVPDKDGNPDPAMAEFARFVLSRTGQQSIAEQGIFLPLRAEQVTGSLASLGRCSSP